MISNVATVATPPFWCTAQETKSACDILSDTKFARFHNGFMYGVRMFGAKWSR